MNPAQVTAFEGANPAGGLTVAGLAGLFAGLLAVVVLIWMAWLAVSIYRNWGDGRSSNRQAGSQLMRGMLVMMVLLTVVTVWG